MNTNEWGHPHADHSDRAFDRKVGALVRRYRLAGGNSLSHLASVMTFFGHRWDTGIASRVELGKRRLQLREAQNLAALFGVGIDELMPEFRPDLQKRESDPWYTEPTIALDESRGFIPWLLRQADRDDPVGDLARDVQNDRRPCGSAEELRDRLTWQPAVESLDRAEAEWRNLTSS